MIFLYALLAHLIADYLLQPANLVDWKNKSLKGVFVHASIHFLITTLTLYLLTGNALVILLALGIAIAHFCIDTVKAHYEKSDRNHYLDYWLDQLSHLVTIFLGNLIAQYYLFQITVIPEFPNQNLWQMLFFNPALIGFLIVAIFSTLTIEYSHNYLIPAKSKTGKVKKLNQQAMVKRLFLASLIYIGLLFSFIPSMSFSF